MESKSVSDRDVQWLAANVGRSITTFKVYIKRLGLVWDGSAWFDSD